MCVCLCVSQSRVGTLCALCFCSCPMQSAHKHMSITDYLASSAIDFCQWAESSITQLPHHTLTWRKMGHQLVTKEIVVDPVGVRATLLCNQLTASGQLAPLVLECCHRRFEPHQDCALIGRSNGPQKVTAPGTARWKGERWAPTGGDRSS